MFNSRNLLLGLVAASVSFDGGNWSGAIAQTSRQIREIGQLSTGEKVIEVPPEYLSQDTFRQALQKPLYVSPNLRYSRNGEPIIYDANQSRVFLWNGSKLTFAGYGITTIQDFKVGGTTYWASLCSDYSLCYGLIVSKPNLISPNKVNGFDKSLFLLNLRKDPTQEGFFYVETRNGNGLNTSEITYLTNLSLTVQNPSKNAVVCEVSRFTNLRNGGRSAVTENPNCQTGKQLTSRYETIPSVSSSTKPSEGYFSDAELRQIERDFQTIIKEPTQGLAIEGDRRQQSDIAKINRFVDAWKQTDPSIAHFLGNWVTYEGALSIYPSRDKGYVCLVGNSLGRFIGDKTYGVGKVSGNQLLTKGEIGENIIIKKRGQFPKRGASRKTFVTQETDILLMLKTNNGKRVGGSRAFVFPSPLTQIDDNRLAQLGCISSLPLSTSSIPSVPPSSTPVRPTDAIAKYPTNEDFKKVDRILRASRNPASLVNLKGNQQNQRRKFQREWESRNPAAAKFLGGWYTGNKSFYVYPSTAKGGTCVVTKDYQGNLTMQIGTVLNRELRYGGGKGFFWIDRENIVASRDSGNGDLYPIYATSEVPELPASIISDMERQKCITTLPF